MTTLTLPAIGALAPDFTADSDRGTRVSLRTLRGRPVVLYFYPKDDTPSCTTEACQFRDQFPRFASLDAIVLGVSPDDVRSHAKFRDKHALPFTLLADTDHAIAERYGVWQEKSMYGRKYMGVVRTTFLIDRKGRIARVGEKVRSSGHAEQVAAAVEALPARG
jgi:peroxiredoxin Q/BCP